MIVASHTDSSQTKSFYARRYHQLSFSSILVLRLLQIGWLQIGCNYQQSCASGASHRRPRNPRKQSSNKSDTNPHAVLSRRVRPVVSEVAINRNGLD
jgi:hypothetical protein